MAYATRRVVKGPGGKPKVVWVDPQTNEQLTHAEAVTREIIEQGDNLDFLEEWKNRSKDKNASDVGLGDLSDGKAVDELPGGNGYDSPDPTYSTPRTEENNFGFTSKPGILSLLTKTPGPFGLIAKAVNIALNANNTAAVASAREHLGLPPLSIPQMIANTVGPGGGKGFVGDLVVGEEQFAVSLDGKSAAGREAISAHSAAALVEAAQEAGVEARPATPQETRAEEQAHVSENGKLGDRVAQAVVNAIRGEPGDPVNTGDVVESFNEAGQAQTVAADGAIPVETTETLAPVQTTDTATPVAGTGIAPSPAPSNNGGAAGRTITPGLGLANLAPNGLTGSGTRFVENYGPKRPEPPTNPNLLPIITKSVTEALGPGHTVVGISGTGEYGSSRHRGGDALDFDVIDGAGRRVTDPTKLQQVAHALGKNGIGSAGHGAGYMGQGRIHADIAELSAGQGTSWGGDAGFAKSFAAGKALSGIQGGVSAVGSLPGMASTPSPNPGQGGSVAQGLVDSVVTNTTTGQGGGTYNTVSGEAPAGRGLTQADLSEMATTIAGELGSRTVQAILSGNPAALAIARDEIANIAHTMHNRTNSRTAAAKGLTAVDIATDGGQYNSRLPHNMGTTNANLGLIGGFLSKTLGEFNSGNLTGSAQNATHYHSLTSPSDPGWSKSSVNAVNSGEHVFSNVVNGAGQLEYFPNLPVSNIPTPATVPGNSQGKESIASKLIDQTITEGTGVSGGTSGNTNAGGGGYQAPSTPGAVGTGGSGGSSSTGGGIVSSGGEGGSPAGLGNAAGGTGLAGEGLTGPAGESLFGGGSGWLSNPDGTSAVGGFGGSVAGGFGGHSAGSLGGSATGAGSGLGAVGSPTGVAGNGLGALGSTATTGAGGGYNNVSGSGLGNLGVGKGPLELTITPGPIGIDTTTTNSISGGIAGGIASGIGSSGSGSGGGGFGSTADGPGGTYGGGYGGGGYASVGGASNSSTSGGFGGGFNTAEGHSEEGVTTLGMITVTAEDTGSNTGAIGIDGQGGFGGGGGGGGSKIICGYFYGKGKIPRNIYVGDLRYAQTKLPKRTREGYLLWATPLVNFLEKKPNRPILDKIVFPFTKGWVYEMAYRAGHTKERSLWGRIVTSTLEPICYTLGYIKEKLDEK